MVARADFRVMIFDYWKSDEREKIVKELYRQAFGFGDRHDDDCYLLAAYDNEQMAFFGYLLRNRRCQIL